MHSQTSWAKNILMWGLVFVALGLVVGIVGLVLPALVGGLTFDTRGITAIGILFLGLGIAALAQYAVIRRDPKAGRQMMINERDERLQMIRAKAGQRAFWTSSGLAYFVLIWSSFAGDVGLPTLSGDTLWYALAVVVVVPLIVYIVSITYEEKNR